MFSQIGSKPKDYEKAMISWRRDNASGDAPRAMIFRYPGPQDDMRKIQYIAVKDYERAVYYHKGVCEGALEGGIYKVEPQARTKATEVVWVDMGLVPISWGVPQHEGVRTSDGIQVGMHGELKIKVRDPVLFLKAVVAAYPRYSDEDAKTWIKATLHTSLRDITKQYPLMGLEGEDREKWVTRVSGKVGEDFADLGLELVHFDLIKVLPPPGAEGILGLQGKKTQAMIKGNEQEVSKGERERQLLVDRIEELKSRLKPLEDAFLDGSTTEVDYTTQKQRVLDLIKEKEGELAQLTNKI